MKFVFVTLRRTPEEKQAMTDLKDTTKESEKSCQLRSRLGENHFRRKSPHKNLKEKFFQNKGIVEWLKCP